LTEQGISAARSYAKAAFEVAMQKRDVKGWSADLERLVEILTDPDIARTFDNPRLDDGRRIGIALGLLPDDFDGDRANFVKLLVLAHRTDVIATIREEFEAMVAEAEGRTELQVVVAREVSSEGRERLGRLLGEKLGGEVQLDLRVDPGILGGVIVRRGDHVADGSVQRRLNQMREELLVS
jgi:F-type H+-transporting ATPase subunit delta